MNSPAHQCRIAAIDDDEAILDAICLVLESQGWCVRTYTAGDAFLVDLNWYKPDCLILDPHVSGVSAATIAKSMAHGIGRIPIIGLTARPLSAQTLELIELGVCVMLTKPVTAEALSSHIDAAISLA